MCWIVLISSDARINEPYKFSNATIKSQRAATRAIARTHRNYVAACEICRFRGDRLDEPRKLINIFRKLGYVFRFSTEPNVCLSPSMYIVYVPTILSTVCARAFVFLRACAYLCACMHLGMHVTWNKWRY